MEAEDKNEKNQIVVKAVWWNNWTISLHKITTDLTREIKHEDQATSKSKEEH